MKYYKGWTTYPMEDYVSGSDKAWRFTIAGGYTTIHDSNLWIPKSIVKISEPNEVGNVYVYLPMWFVAKNQLFKSVERIREIEFDEVVEL